MPADPTIAPADVVVVGTGAAALTAAITAHDAGARVTVVERTSSVGGTTAVSGGGIWMPQNDHMAELGLDDSREEALAYMTRLTAGRTPDRAARTLSWTQGPGIMADLEKRTGLRLSPMSWPDYHPEMDGAKASGRMLEPVLFDTKRLGGWAASLRRPPVLGMPITLQEATVDWRPTYFPERFEAAEVQRRVADGQVACGQALIGALLEACLSRGIEPLLDTRATQIAMRGDQVSGLVSTVAGHNDEIPATAVVLASGGYEWNPRLRARFLPGPLTHPHSPPANEGDGLLMAMEVGADLANMNETWWYPASSVPGEEYEGRPLARFVGVERTAPHSIIVDRFGQRFVNEAANYNDMQKAFFSFDANEYSTRHLPCWVVFDHQYRSRYPVVTARPGRPRSRVAARPREPRGPGPQGRDRSGRTGRDGRALEPLRGRWAGPRLRPRVECLRPLPRGSECRPSQPGHHRAGPLLRPPRPRRFGGDEGGPEGRRPRPGHARQGPSHPRPVRRGKRRGQPGRPRVLRRGHLDRHGHGVGAPRRHPRRGVRHGRRPVPMSAGVAEAPDPAARRRMYELMTLILTCDERIRRGLSAGEFAFTYWPATGQEAVAAALGTVLENDDQLVSTYRGLHDQVAKGVPLGPLVAEILTRRTGVNAGKGGAMHISHPPSGLVLSTGIVGSGLPIAVGVGLAAPVRGSRQVTVASFGDGATGTGSFHEAVNLAALWNIPIVFVCQNNRYAEMTPTAEAQPVTSVADRAAGYGIPGEQVDGNDPDAVHRSLAAAVARARSGGGPTLLECMTYRLWGHYFGDPMRYIPKEELEAARQAEPVGRYRARLIADGVLDDAGADDIDRSAGDEVESAFAAALAAALPDPGDAFVDVYGNTGGTG